jgi:hypothetical protein
VAAVFIFLADHEIVMADLANLAGYDSCQALSAIAVAATVAERETGAQACFEQGGTTLAREGSAAGQYGYVAWHRSVSGLAIMNASVPILTLAAAAR